MILEEIVLFLDFFCKRRKICKEKKFFEKYIIFLRLNVIVIMEVKGDLVFLVMIVLFLVFLFRLLVVGF